MGNLTQGQKTIVMGMVELDMYTWQETGNIRLIIIPDPTLRAFSRTH